MTPSEVEWYTIILPFILTPIIIVSLVFFIYIWPSWINSFEEIPED